MRSKFFSVKEWQAQDPLGEPYPQKWIESRWLTLARMLDVIREACGSALIVTPRGGYRPEALNRRIGGARRSQHVEGRAADIRPPGAIDSRRIIDLHDEILGLYNDGAIPALGGLGEYPSFVHVDVRSTARLVRWVGSRTES